MIYNILIFLILVILIIFYGGENKIHKIKYNSIRFNYYKNISIFRKKLFKLVIAVFNKFILST